MLGTRHMPLYKIECNIAMGFFFVMIFHEPPQKHQKIYRLLCQYSPHNSNWRKTEPVSNLPFSDISNSQESKTCRNMRSYVEWCMFTYLDIAWNYKVTKINQLINQNRRTPSIRHQSGLNLLLVFSMPLDVFPFRFRSNETCTHTLFLAVKTMRMDKLIFIIVIQSKTCLLVFQFWIRWVGISYPLFSSF